jgi:hypothetical protein
MARRKNRPEAVQEKYVLSERLREIRVELFGERGGSEMARRLGLPVRTWYNYESGVTVPAEILLRFVELTAVEPSWLLHGRGPRFRAASLPPGGPTNMVRDLLRIALNKLERREELGAPSGDPARHRIIAAAPEGAAQDSTLIDDVVLVRVEPSRTRSIGPADDLAPQYLAAPRDWNPQGESVSCVRVEDDSMAPLLREGAYVAFCDSEPDIDRLAGRLVVAWIDGSPLVRWYEPAGHGKYALLRAENPRTHPASTLIDLESPATERRIRRVLWTCTPH